MTYLRELCVENHVGVREGLARGADRIELCDNLAVGGTTVSVGVAEHVASLCAPADVPVMAIVRPRGGVFVYDADEVRIMRRDIRALAAAGVTGFVIGAITAESELDKAVIEQLLQESGSSPVTFHMAFDAIRPQAQAAALEWLAGAGVARVLTHGGALHLPITATVDRLRELIEQASGRIVVMPGGGVTRANADWVAEQTGAQELHGTRIV